jgi:hypothetical protein
MSIHKKTKIHEPFRDSLSGLPSHEWLRCNIRGHFGKCFVVVDIIVVAAEAFVWLYIACLLRRPFIALVVVPICGLRLSHGCCRCPRFGLVVAAFAVVVVAVPFC